MEPIEHTESSCNLAAFLMISAISSYNWKTRREEISCVEAMNFLDAYKSTLSQFDPVWQPGGTLTTRPILRERRRLFTSEPVLIFSQIPLQLYNAGHMARVVAHRFRKITRETNELLNLAALLCLTAWRFVRDLRKGEEKWRVGKDPTTMNLNLERILKLESTALHEATHAAWDAGHYLTFPVLAHLYLWSADRNCENVKYHHTIANYFAKWIHQLGLEMPPPFERKNKPNPPRMIHQSRQDNPYWWRISQDQKYNRDWLIVLKSYPEWKQLLPTSGEPNADPCFYDPFGVFKSLSFAINEGAYSNPTVARCAFQLALKYGWTGLAEKLLAGFQPAKKEVLDFCHHLKRIQQACPFGIDDSDDQHPAWRRVLKTSWASLPSGDSLNSEERLAAHEVLVGRSVELLRWKGKTASPFLIKKFNDLASEEEIRAAIGNDGAVFSPGVGTINATKVIGLMRAVSGSAMGSCACVSIVRLPGDKLSFLAVDQSCGTPAKWVVETKSFPGLEDELQALNDTRDDWLKIGDQTSFEPPIDWDEQCIKLCEFVSAMARRLNKDCQWLMLALEQDLAELPWQDLVRRFWGGNKPVFVSLIPNIGWAGRGYRDVESFPKHAHNKTDLSDEADFSEFRSQIESDLNEKTSFIGSTAIYLGHGKRENGFTTVKSGTGLLDREAWLDVGTYRTVVIHSCSAGRLHGGFLGDFGGVPALALATGCRLVCAPITEVPLHTAKILHKHHVSKSGPLEFGHRYMLALGEDPWVGVYTCYGFGNQFVAAPSRG